MREGALKWDYYRRESLASFSECKHDDQGLFFFHVIDVEKDLNCAWADLGSQSGKRIEDSRQHTTCIYISSTRQISYISIIEYVIVIGWPKCKFILKTPPFFRLCLTHVRIDSRLSPPLHLSCLDWGAGNGTRDILGMRLPFMAESIWKLLWWCNP